MKNIMFLLIAMLMSLGTSTFAGTTTAAQPANTKISIPVNIIVKQTIVFNDGTVVEVYYQKRGDVCKLYSKTDVTKYTEKELNRVKSSNFEIADHVEGRCLMTKKTADVISLARSLIKQIE